MTKRPRQSKPYQIFAFLLRLGSRYFGWSDPSGKIQLALFTAFILGIVASYKSKG